MRRKVKFWMWVFSFLVVALIAYILGIKTQQQLALKKPVITAASLSSPNMSNSDVAVWANEAAVTIFSYNFADYQTSLQKAAQYFTPAGWKTYSAAMQKSGVLAQVVKNKLVVSAVATGSPRIVGQGEIAGIYTWKIELPLLVFYQSATSSTQQSLKVTMEMERVKQYLGKRGLGIVSFDSKEQKAAKSKQTEPQIPQQMSAPEQKSAP